MNRISDFVQRIILLRKERNIKITLLAICPNSEAVLEAAILSALRNNAPMLFAATLNQVDRDKGYTGWTQLEFVKKINFHAKKNKWSGPLYPFLIMEVRG